MNFMAPVLIGETITAVATIAAIDEKRRRVVLKTQCLNGDKVVVDGEATILVPRRDVG
jgi:3-hydroxybutyryl-CoA dehydratase